MGTPEERSYYRILGVSPASSTEEIRREYHRLARVLHPDRYGDASPAERALAERRMREVTAAWSVLRDGEARRNYDRSRFGAGAPRSNGSPPRSGSGPSAPSGPAGREATEPVWSTTRDEIDDELLDEPPLPEWQYHLLRRGPVVVALVVLFLLFLVTAYANTGRMSEPSATTQFARCGPELGIPC